MGVSTKQLYLLIEACFPLGVGDLTGLRSGSAQELGSSGSFLLSHLFSMDDRIGFHVEHFLLFFVLGFGAITGSAQYWGWKWG